MSEPSFSAETDFRPINRCRSRYRLSLGIFWNDIRCASFYYLWPQFTQSTHWSHCWALIHGASSTERYHRHCPKQVERTKACFALVECCVHEKRARAEPYRASSPFSPSTLIANNFIATMCPPQWSESHSEWPGRWTDGRNGCHRPMEFHASHHFETITIKSERPSIVRLCDLWGMLGATYMNRIRIFPECAARFHIISSEVAALKSSLGLFFVRSFQINIFSTPMLFIVFTLRSPLHIWPCRFVYSHSLRSILHTVSVCACLRFVPLLVSLHISEYAETLS